MSRVKLPTITERAADIVSARRFANREKLIMAQKIVDFMDIPSRQPSRYYALTPGERAAIKYTEQCAALRAHVTCRHVIWLVQSGQIL